MRKTTFMKLQSVAFSLQTRGSFIDATQNCPFIRVILIVVRRLDEWESRVWSEKSYEIYLEVRLDRS